MLIVMSTYMLSPGFPGSSEGTGLLPAMQETSVKSWSGGGEIVSGGLSVEGSKEWETTSDTLLSWVKSNAKN